MKTQSVIALLGKRDAPTDAVEEYCRYLGRALAAHGISLELRRVPWDSRGWSESLKGLRLQAQSLPPHTWFLVQYTALAWSARTLCARHRFRKQSVAGSGERGSRS